MLTVCGKETGAVARHVGFTLLETVAVLVVMAVLTAYLISRMQTGSSELPAETAVLKAHLRFARSRAMSDQGSDWEVRFAAGAGGSYTLYKNGAVASHNWPGENGPTHTLPGSVSLAISTSPTLAFSASGSPGTSDRTITLSAESNTKTVTVSANTGYVP